MKLTEEQVFDEYHVKDIQNDIEYYIFLSEQGVNNLKKLGCQVTKMRNDKK